MAMKKPANLTPDALVKWRKKNGYTQIRLGKELGVTALTVYRWEKAMREIPAFLHLALKYLELKGGEIGAEDKRRSKGIKNQHERRH